MSQCHIVWVLNTNKGRMVHEFIFEKEEVKQMNK